MGKTARGQISNKYFQNRVQKYDLELTRHVGDMLYTTAIQKQENQPPRNSPRLYNTVVPLIDQSSTKTSSGSIALLLILQTELRFLARSYAEQGSPWRYSSSQSPPLFRPQFHLHCQGQEPVRAGRCLVRHYLIPRTTRYYKPHLNRRCKQY